jgi:hypothetical protein
MRWSQPSELNNMTEFLTPAVAPAEDLLMPKTFNLCLVALVAVSMNPAGAIAHDGEDDHAVNQQQYAPGTYPQYAPGYPVQSGAGHTNDPRLNPGHNNSLRHQVKDAINSRGQGLAPGYAGYGAPGVAPVYGGYPANSYQAGQGYLGQPGAGHINDPSINPGHNNSLGHQLKDAINPNGMPAYGSSAVPGSGYGYPGVAPVGANHVNNPYINPGHNGSVQHQMNDTVNGNQGFPAQLPMANRRGHRHGHGHDDH